MIRALLLTIFASFTVYSQAQIVHIQEDFNAASLPLGWSNTAVNGSHNWSFGIDGSTNDAGNNNLDSTNMVFFDDDNYGSVANNNTVELKTPAFDNTAYLATFLEFDYNLRVFPNLNDSFYVEVYDGSNWNVVFSVNQDDCGRYTNLVSLSLCEIIGFPHALINISAYTNANCQVRFTYHDGNSWAWYVALDNVEIYSVPNEDIGVSNVLSPLNNACGLSTQEPLEIEITNYGGDTASGFSIEGNVNGNTFLESISNKIAPFKTLVHTTTTTFDFSSSGTYSIHANTTFTNDSFPLNDSLNFNIDIDSIFSLPYQESFETTNHDWFTYGDNNSWEIGSPSGLIINTASDGFNSLITNTDGDYNNKENSYFQSPCISKDTNSEFVFLSFDLFLDTELNTDKLFLEYSTDEGNSWKILKEVYPTFSPQHTQNFDHSWSGSSNGWTNIFTVIRGLKHKDKLALRFLFKSDGQNKNEGIAIDNIQIQEAPNTDAQLFQLNFNSISQEGCLLSEAGIEFEIINKGLQSIDSMLVYYLVKGDSMYIDTISNNIQPLDSIHYQSKHNLKLIESSFNQILSWIEVINDSISSNDSMEAAFDISNYFELPYHDNFDHINSSNTGDWTLNNPSNSFYTNYTTSNNNNPSQDHTGAGGNFLLIQKRTNGNFNEELLFESPCIFIDAPNSLLSFWYYFYSGNVIINPLIIDIYDGDKWHNGIDSIKNKTAQSINRPFREKRISLAAFKDKNIKIRMRLKYDNVTLDYALGIDDISIYKPISRDVQLWLNKPLPKNHSMDGTSGMDSCFGGLNDVEIRVRNVGSDSLAAKSFLLHYQFNSGLIVTDTFQSSLQPHKEKIHLFSQPIDPSLKKGLNQIKIWHALNLDSNLIMDTINYSFFNTEISLPHIQDFNNLENEFCGYDLNNYQDFCSLNYRQRIGWRSNSWYYQNLKYHFTQPGRILEENLWKDGHLFAFPPSPISPRNSLVSPCINLSNISDGEMGVFYNNYFNDTLNKIYLDVFRNNQWFNKVDSMQMQKNMSIDQRAYMGFDLSTYTNDNIHLRLKNGSGYIFESWFFDKDSIDLGIVQLTTPTQSYFSCDFSEQEAITATIHNFGRNAISSNTAQIELYLNGTLEATETINSSISANSSLDYTFLKTIDLSKPQSRNFLQARIVLNADSNPSNDSSTVYRYLNKKIGIGYKEDFEKFNSEEECNINHGIPAISFRGIKEVNWELGIEYPGVNYAWMPHSPSNCNYLPNQGGTPTVETGPQEDHSPVGNTFIYTEASSFSFNPPLNKGDSAFIVFPCVDLTNLSLASFNFWYHKYGLRMGDLFIDVDTNGGWITIDSIVGETHVSHTSPWISRAVVLNDFIGKNIGIRFRAIRGTGQKGDMALDDIELKGLLITNTKDLSTNEKHDLIIFPNPSEGLFQIKSANYLQGKAVKVFNIQGKEIERFLLQSSKHEVDLNHLEKGLYFLQVEGEQISKKIVIL